MPATTIENASIKECTAQIVKNIKRTLSFGRKRNCAANAKQAVILVDAATDAPLLRRASLPSRASEHQVAIPRTSRRSSFQGVSKRVSLPPRASQVRDAIRPLWAAYQSGTRCSERLSLPPRASQVREAMRPLYGREPSRSSLDLNVARSRLTRSPSQPEALVGIIRRASTGGAPRTLRLVKKSSFHDAPPSASEIREAMHHVTTRQERRRARRLKYSRMIHDADQSESTPEAEATTPRRPPRASDVARAVGALYDM